VAQKETIAMGIQRTNITAEFLRISSALYRSTVRMAIDFLTKKRVLFTDVNLKKREKG
jgi:hypothetical protein